MSDKFILLSDAFKEGYKTRYKPDGKKILKNLANVGGEIGTKLFVNRNGEYNGIIIELQEKVYPLYLDSIVHSIYLNIESNYVNNIHLIDKLGLTQLYQKYSNEIFRFIVDQFLICNNSQSIYSNYPKIISNIKSQDILDLKSLINSDIHKLIPCKIKVISCGELLPEDWIGKIFDSGDALHRYIDVLEARINKPPVTYLANYCMEYYEENNLLETKDLGPKEFNKENTNIWVQDLATGKIIKDESKIDISKLSNYIKIPIGDNFITILYSKDYTFEQTNIELSSGLVGFNVSLMQKSFRRGPDVLDNLKEAIIKLSKTKPYNNPEHQYELMSGSRQLFWRYFISVIEDIQIYKSEKYFDIFDLVIYSYIYGTYPHLIMNQKLTNKLIELGEKLLHIKSYIDFNDYKEDTTNLINLKCRYQISLKISNDLMPGMKGDKKMIRCLITFIKSKPELLDIDKLEIKMLEENPIYKKIGWYAGVDLHTNPQFIVQFQNAVFNKETEDPVNLETCSSLIWHKSSCYNIRKHKKFSWKKINDLIYLIQYLWFNPIEKVKLLDLPNNYTNKYWNYEYNLVDNLQKIKFKYLKNQIEFAGLQFNISDEKFEHMVTKNQICQIILSSQSRNNFWYLNKKTLPIYTNDQIKFKYLEEVLCNDSDQYEKMFTAYKKYLGIYETKISIGKLEYKTSYSDNHIYINKIPCIKINPDYTIEYLDSVYKLIGDELIYKSSLDTKTTLYSVLEELVSSSCFQIDTYINYKSIICIQSKPNQIIQNDLIKKIPNNIKQIILSRVLTSLEDKQDRTTLILACIDRSGKASGDSVDSIYEGYLVRLFNIFPILYGCFTRVNEYKFIIDIKSKIFRHWLKNMGYNIDNKSVPDIKIKPLIKTKLWEHQTKVRDMVMNGIIKYGQRGFGDASEVGSGKTLTALSCIEKINMLSPNSNYLILVPNTNLYGVWETEIKNHCENVGCKIQESDGKWETKITTNVGPTIWISTMGRNRDHQLKNEINFVVVDECLSVQNKESKWTIKAFEQVVRAKYGVLMLSATFFRTRFDKLFFMLKMLCSGIPTKSEYLDTILNTAIGANIKTNRIEWETTYHKIRPDKKFYLEYEANKISDKFESYIKLKKYLNNNIKFEEVIENKVKELIKNKRKILVYVESETQLEIFKQHVEKNKLQWGFYPDIEKDVCVISKHKGTYGINNLVKYNTILMKPPEPDKLPQIKGRLDRPTQTAKKLYLEYVVVADTIEEIDIVKLELSNTFYRGHIVPLANYYDKYC
jgi:hypothetical protein